MRGLYIHVPFCVKKCDYCDFYSLPDRTDIMKSYVEAVLKEAEAYARLNPSVSPFDKGSFRTLYLGGGTPSLLGAENLKLLLDGLNRSLSLQLTEATIEVNPESGTKELLEAARESGFTRVSIGVQSLADSELRSVGRIHTASQAVEAVGRAKEAGFEAISADLIIGLPGQTRSSLSESVNTLVRLGVQHLSIYCLQLEDGTILGNKPPEDLPSDEMQASLFAETKDLLDVCGYTHYEISNFAKRGYECMHNINYWHGGEYLGLGPAAASHLGGKRFKNRADLDAYMKDPTGQVEEVEELGVEDKAAEEAMLRLRLIEEGLDTVELAKKFGDSSVVGITGRCREMAREGLLVPEGTRFRLNPERIMTSNPIFERVLVG